MKSNNILPVNIHSFVHRVVKGQIALKERIEEQPKLTMVNFLTNLVLDCDSQTNSVLLAVRLFRHVHPWGRPWKSVYISKSAHLHLSTLVGKLNESLTPRVASRLPHDVNASNLLSALILERAIASQSIQKLQYIESNFGYRLLIEVPSASQRKII